MLDRSALLARIADLAEARVLCLGDVILDRYVYGNVERVSPEAPIPILRVERERTMPGGAGNVVRNLAALGARTRFLSVIGSDAAGRELRALLEAEEGVVPLLRVEAERETSVKTRFVAAGQQLLRADRESMRPITTESENELVSGLAHAIGEAGVLVISDYGKGVLTERVLADALAAAAAAGRRVVVDPKSADYGCYRGADVITPNRAELALASRMPVGSDEEVVAAAKALIASCRFSAVLATRGPDGMTLVGADGAVDHLKAEAREVFDVSGAGDTVVATIAAGLAVGLDLVDAAQLANAAAGIVVGKAGTAVVHARELSSALAEHAHAAQEAKIMPLAAALERIETWRRQGARIGFTNGCFDLLHPGHVALLARARAACDRLVVGLNSDASVARLKGAGRPVQSEGARALVLASLSSVDLVVAFAEDTPLKLIEAIRPALLVKGADYAREAVVGGDLVERYGGKVLLVDLVPGQSTSATLSRAGR